jgi:hypothetical protein
MNREGFPKGINIMNDLTYIIYIFYNFDREGPRGADLYIANKLICDY